MIVKTCTWTEAIDATGQFCFCWKELVSLEKNHDNAEVGDKDDEKERQPGRNHLGHSWMEYEDEYEDEYANEYEDDEKERQPGRNHLGHSCPGNRGLSSHPVTIIEVWFWGERQKHRWRVDDYKYDDIIGEYDEYDECDD